MLRIGGSQTKVQLATESFTVTEYSSSMSFVVVSVIIAVFGVGPGAQLRSLVSLPEKEILLIV